MAGVAPVILMPQKVNEDTALIILMKNLKMTKNKTPSLKLAKIGDFVPPHVWLMIIIPESFKKLR